MCGIVGMAQVGEKARAPLDQLRLLRMRETLQHRGPDDAGLWLDPEGGVGLAHRRLSILDLSAAGRQPMHDQVGQTWITYNGEIYNFQELRAELEPLGHRFVSGSDTEVLLAAYREWREDCLDHLNGMFAFALYDASARQLFLARDRVGKKPLYYAFSGGEFLFASELKSLLQDPRVSRDIDLRALNFFLAYGFIPGERSIFRSIRKLPPAHAMVLNLANGSLHRWCYWRLPEPTREYRDESDLLAELEPLLEDAVRIRLRSDVPLGVFLSGGLDSSLIVALMSRVTSQPVQTFTIGFDQADRDERKYARIVADHFGTRHHELVLQQDALEVLPELVQQFDEPFADPSLIPTYYVCRETRKSVTVALSGDGGDELFGGYLRYGLAYRDAHIMRYLPAPLRRWAAIGSRCLPAGSWSRGYIQRLGGEAARPYIAQHLLFDLEARRKLLQPEICHALGSNLEEPEAYLRTEFERTVGQDFVNRMTSTDFQSYLPDDILVKVDRTSMFVSLEVRAPLLDYRIADFVFAQVPGSLKVTRQGKKLLLKKYAERLLPSSLPLDRKAGFSFPLRDWIGQNAALTNVALSARTDLFNHAAMAELMYSGHSRSELQDRRVFALLVFELWRQAYGGPHRG